MTPEFRGKNRRRGERYSLQLTLRYRSAGQVWRTGTTINMSGTGMLASIPQPLLPGARIEIAMDWPGVYHGVERMRLFLLTTVVRTDEKGTALRIRRRQFCDVSPTQRKLAVA